jgi:hypothetical protein
MAQRLALALVVVVLAGCGAGTAGSGAPSDGGTDATSDATSGIASSDAASSVVDGTSSSEGDANLGHGFDGSLETGSTSDGSVDTGPAEDGGTEASLSSEGGAHAVQVFPQCQFHFGTIDSNAKNDPSLIDQLDMFTSGWIGTSSTFNLGSVCTETNAGGAFYGKVPALVSYIIAFTARSDPPNFCLADCNATNAGTGCATTSDLCTKGADYLRQEFTSRVLPAYATFAQGFAGACGTARPMIWEMEPDYFQYYDAAQGGGTRGQAGGPLSGAEAANYMSQMIATVKQYLPNAVFSMDTSPWMSNNGCAGSNPATDPGWYPFFDMSQFTFVNTSGGGTLANSANIRAGEATWAGVHQCSGNKPILADTGYGAAGGSAGPDPNWDVPANINARIVDGVISITQYNPNAATWGATIAANRSMLSPVNCY